MSDVPSHASLLRLGSPLLAVDVAGRLLALGVLLVGADAMSLDPSPLPVASEMLGGGSGGEDQDGGWNLFLTSITTGQSLALAVSSQRTSQTWTRYLPHRAPQVPKEKRSSVCSP